MSKNNKKCVHRAPYATGLICNRLVATALAFKDKGNLSSESIFNMPVLIPCMCGDKSLFVVSDPLQLLLWFALLFLGSTLNIIRQFHSNTKSH